MKTRLFALAGIAILAACGGGGGTGTPAGPPVSQASATPAPKPTQNPNGQYAKFTITFAVGNASHGRVHPYYVSPNSTQVEVKVNSVNGGTPPNWVNPDVTTALDFTAGTGNCTVSAGTATCSISVAAPPGTVNYTIQTLDGSNNVLDTGTQDETIAQGQANSISMTLHGIVKTVTISLPALTANTSQSAAGITVGALDASGAQITGSASFENPITLTDDDAAGQTLLSVNGGTAASAVTMNAPGDAITLSYAGQAVNPITVTASGTGITGSGSVTPSVFDITFTGTSLDAAGNGGTSTDRNWGQQTLFFGSASGSQNISAAEVGFTNAPYSQQFDITLDSSCASGNIASASASPATTFTITALGTAGICSGRITEHGTGYPITTHPSASSGSATHDGTFWISVTSGSFTIN